MRNSTPLVSIITITRNRGHLISSAIKSVIEQSYQNIEYLIVNGASTDNTTEVVESFNDPRIKLINLEKNYPIPQTINIGFEKSQGQFITFLDDDDEYLPLKIEKQLKLIEKLSDDYGFVYCWMDYYHAATNRLVKEHHPELRGDVSALVVEEPIISGTPTYFFRRAVFEKLKGWKDGIGIISDWELAARACQHYKVDYVPEVLVKIKVNHGATRMSEKKKYDINYYQNQIIFRKYFLEEFSNIFEVYPQKRWPHLYTISYSYFLAGKFSLGIKYYLRQLEVNFNIKSVLLPITCQVRRLQGKP